MKPVRLAQVGVGNWGRNLLRAFASQPGVEVAWACDVRAEALAAAARHHPHLHTTARVEDVLDDEAVEAVVIATETPQHAPCAEAALRAGKHVFVEKPLAHAVEDAERLVALAEASGKTLMVGHLLRYHPAFEHVERLIRDGALGEVHYLYSQRVNLGVVRRHENAFDSLAPHDLALALALIGRPAVAVAAQGHAYLQPGVEDVVFATVFFDGGALAHLHTSWLDPHKVRKVTVVGSRQMAVVDDMEPAEKVRLYDKGAVLLQEDAFTGFAGAVAVRSGDVVIPHVPTTEPLRLEAEAFLTSVREGTPPRTGGREGLAVVRILDAARRSLAAQGARIELGKTGDGGLKTEGGPKP
ncbi:MAG TPA: Gfo/Idh/MocA family oxidoreductase [Rubricoccaceae bacterium]|nr:Gfo/Idh/MocA family oxidoreductase [Rubricoccaceae bacterium]